MDPFSALRAYALNHASMPPSCYRLRPVHWILDLRINTPDDVPNATIVPFGDDRDAVPTMRRSGTVPAPFLGVDTATYVLGVANQRTNPKQTAIRAEAFWRQIGEWAAGEHSHPAVGAALAVVHMAGPAMCEHPVAPDDRVAVRVDGVFLHRLPEAVAAWADIVSDRKTSGRTGLCLACQKVRPLADTLPNGIAKGLVPGADWETMFAVPGDKTSMSQGLPVCVPCGDLAVSALETLLADRAHTGRFAGQGSAVVSFSPSGPEADRRVVELMSMLGAARV